MSSKGNYRLAAAVDIVLLWGRLGGKFAIVALIAFGVVRIIPGLPAVAAPAILALALLFAVAAVWRLRPFLEVRKNGIPMEGYITAVDERKVSRSDGGRHLKKRLSFRYEVAGNEYAGQTTWGSSGRFGTLGRGNPIPLVVDPAHPDGAVWAEDMPIRMPQVIGL